MYNKIVSTNYIPLQPPYQIIKYRGDIAMQIGTLIVTIQKEGNVNDLGYEIETHSHPVVTYENKYKTEQNHQLTAYQFLEGAVWNFVEVKDVTTICLSNSRLPWKEFLVYLRHDIERRQYMGAPLIESFWSIDRLCDGIELPEFKNYIVYLEIHNYKKSNGNDTSVIRSRTGDIIALHSDMDKEKQCWKDILMQFLNYMIIFRNKQENTESLKLSFETEDEQLRGLIKFLNSLSISVGPINPNPESISKIMRLLDLVKNNDNIVIE